MCEWLSYQEWCDVKLLCGGQEFNAHRAVLASVSSFLREMLLSCSSDDFPTFIVLPDFDFEAMSSVLYYIYNGEVILPKHKVGMFFEIIKAMQIYIDYENLSQFWDKYEDVPKVNIDRNIYLSPSNIYSLGAEEYKNHNFINLKRIHETQDTMIRHPLGNLDHSDKLCPKESERRKSCLGNLKSSHGDRQRNSFLRDLYIETYPRNGNANGLATSVLAISNEYYRAPASLLLANANDEHLDIISGTNKNQNGLSSRFDKISESHEQFNIEYAVNGNLEMPCNSNILRYPYLRPWYEQHNTSSYVNDLERKKTESQSNISMLQLRYQELKSSKSTIHVPLTTIYNMSKIIPSVDDSIATKLGNRTNTNCSTSELTIPNSTKVLNQVLESPWCTRVPSNYKPFRKKLLDSNEKHQELINVREIKDVNDNNNNIQRSVPVLESVLTTNSDEEHVLSQFSVVNILDNFKCTICNQTFKSDDALALHTKRHSTNSRYACGECGKTFSQLRNFKYHMSIHRGTREFAATCSVCGKYFNDRGYLSSHMKIHRNRKEYKCSLCPKSFNQRVAYNMHVRIHTGVKPHVCDECGKAFSRKMLLKQHQRTHSGERPYACPHCDKRFADRSNMTLHLRLHTGVKPFSCSLCPKSFTKKHHLKSHLNFHTGSKPYSCPRCKLAFTQSSNMRTHLKKCNAPEPSETQTSSTM